MPQTFLGRVSVCRDVCVSRRGCLGSKPLLIVICLLPTPRALAPSSSAQELWNHFNSPHLTSKASLFSRKRPWINVSSATFERITDPSPSFFWSRLAEYCLHLYSIIAILLFSPPSVSHFPRHWREALSWRVYKPICFPSPDKAPLIMKHQKRPANSNPPSTFASPIESNLGLFICLQSSRSKEKGCGDD